MRRGWPARMTASPDGRVAETEGTVPRLSRRARVRPGQQPPRARTGSMAGSQGCCLYMAPGLPNLTPKADLLIPIKDSLTRDLLSECVRVSYVSAFEKGGH
jgi:hypothetical protein